MASVLVNCKIMVGSVDLSGDSNQITMQYGAEMLDDTTFKPVATGGTRSAKPGLKTVKLDGSLFWNTDGTTDLAQFSQIGLSNQVMSVALVGEVEGDRVHFTRGVRSAYNPASGEIGQIVSARLEAQASNAPLVRGQLMKTGVVTVTGNSTGINMGSAANKSIYSALHIVAPITAGGGGEQIIGTIESDDNSGFTTPTVRLTHTTLTSRNSDWQSVAIGAGVTDNYWRAVWTISGAAPSFTIFWSFGMLP